MENVLGNKSLPSESPPDAPSYSLSVVVFLSIAATIGAVENTTICTVACKFTHMRTVPNYLTVSMVLSNLIICTVTIPLNIFLQVDADACFKISCDLLMSFNTFITLVSLWTLCPILLDRYFIVRIPLIYMKRRNVPLAVVSIVISWVAPFILVLLYTLTKEDSLHDREVMTDSWENSKGQRYFVLCMCVGMGLPLLVGFAFNIAILEVVLKRRKRQMQLMPLRLRLHSPGTKRKDSKMSFPVPHLERPRAIRKNTISCGVSSSVSHVTESKIGCQETTGLPGIPLSVINELRSPHDRAKHHLQRPSKSVCIHPNSHPLKLIRLRSISRINLQESLNIATTGTQSAEAQNHNLNRQVFSLHREKKTFVVMFLNLGTLAGSCLPLFVLECYLVRYPEERFVNQYMSKSLWWLNWSSCALNPVLYTIFRKEFRDAFRKLIRR